MEANGGGRMRTEIDQQLRWISRCADGACIEVALAGRNVLVRDSENIGGPVLRFTPEQWKSFQAGVAAGEFD
jgi:hypothetical protein